MIERHVARVRDATKDNRDLIASFVMACVESPGSTAVRSARARFHGPLADFLGRHTSGEWGRADQLLQRALVQSIIGEPDRVT